MKSHVIRMPELSKLDIPEKQRKIFIPDDQIFSELRNEHRRIDDRDGGAEKGDYVLIDLCDPFGHKREIHVELGSRAFSDYTEVLKGCAAGDELQTVINGTEHTIFVKSVRMPVELPLTDETIAGLEIPGVKDLVDYRVKYINEHGEERLDRVFRAIQQGLFDQVLEMAEIQLDPEELDSYNKMQLVMVGNISGNVDERLMMAYGGGDKSLEECKQLFYEDNRRTFSLYVWGRDLASLNGAEPTDADRKQAMDYYCLVFDKSEDEADMEEALMSYYLQYGIGRLREYYQSVSSFSAIGIDSYSMTDRS